MEKVSSEKKLMTLKEASQWASERLDRDISQSNIAYLVQYGKVRKHNGSSATFVDVDDLKAYYRKHFEQKEHQWKKQLGEDLNWSLSFDNLREKDTTKHVHRLHPYKGKFIPQLVEYFLDDHVDAFKKAVSFQAGDIILDPFCGSGTTIVQANEMGMHAIGIDISEFNTMMASVKVKNCDIDALINDINQIKKALATYENDNKVADFEAELLKLMSQFNKTYFPTPDFKYALAQKQIDEIHYASEKEKQFLKEHNKLIKKYKIVLQQNTSNSFLDKWYCRTIRDEIKFVFDLIQSVENVSNRNILALILSRTIRSCRATTHSDLATLKKPQLTTYYCHKHKKICKPLYSIKYWFNRYTTDTVNRLREFTELRSGNTYHALLTGDSRELDIALNLKKNNKALYQKYKQDKIKGIFTSPPYVGQIDYHEQHAYAYELFGLNRRDELEIGPLYKGQGNQAKQAYVEGIANVLKHCRQYLSEDFDIFLVANDKYNLYPSIVKQANMKIVETFKRPVLNRTERDKSPYAEIVFHIKG